MGRSNPHTAPTTTLTSGHSVVNTNRFKANTITAHKHVEEREPKVQLGYALFMTLGGEHFYVALSKAAANHFHIAGHLRAIIKNVPARSVKGAAGKAPVSRSAYSLQLRPRLHRKIKVPKFSNNHFIGKGTKGHSEKHEYFSMRVSSALSNHEIAGALLKLLANAPKANHPDYFVTTSGVRHYFNSGAAM